MRMKPSGRMDARSLRRTVPVMCFHRRIRRRSMCLAAERECLGRGLLQRVAHRESVKEQWGNGGSGSCEWEDLPRPFVVGRGRGKGSKVISDKWASHLSWICGLCVN